jgi:FemAB-related protein (PEP-CTERM system-associated)
MAAPGSGIVEAVAAPLKAPMIDPEVSADAWDGYLARRPDATVDHLWRWRNVFERVFGHRSVYLAVRRGDAVAGVLPLVLFRSRIFGRAVVSVPFLNYGGLVADDAEAARVLVARAGEVAREFGATYVEFRHGARLLEDAPCRQHKVGMIRALPQTVDELWNGTDRKVRNQVRKAQKEGLLAIRGGGELVGEFYQVFSRNMRDLGTPVYSKRLFDTVLADFGGEARVFLVRSGRQPVAAAVAIRFKDVVIVPWASSLREFRTQCPNMLLYWTMLEHAVQERAAAFDFGRSSPGGGTHHFKLQWGAQETPLHWEYVLLGGTPVPDHGPSNPRFSRAIDLWKRCPLWLANVVGPRIVRAIP